MPQIIINDLNPVIDQVSKDKNIDRYLVVEALEQAILAIARKNLGQGYDLEAHFTEETGEIEVFMFKQVVEEVKNAKMEISLEEALKVDPDAIIGDSLGLKVEKNIYGRIEAQVAKQIIFQKIKEIEYKKFIGKKRRDSKRTRKKGRKVGDNSRSRKNRGYSAQTGADIQRNIQAARQDKSRSV
ncbi:MAG: hypothetical protein M1276_08970 [Deltaproteobacteria bacterium]|nr:hypothetical protein [Deltaproteobacteria bacterium]